MEEVEEIKTTLTHTLGFEFRIMEPKSDFPHSTGNVRWVIGIPFLTEGAGVLSGVVIWENNQQIGIDSHQLGNTSAWIEGEYDEDALIEARRKDMTDFAQTRKELERFFPKAFDRLSAYEKMLTDVSTKYDIDLKLSYHAKQSITFFYARIKIDSTNLDMESKITKIKLGIKALKKAMEKINKYEASRTRRIDSRHDMS